jgi:EAL domain-containing protein (putative c-di-GMP-specific phosphodiesterase class I)
LDKKQKNKEAKRTAKAKTTVRCSRSVLVDILDKESVQTDFQPICSILKHKVIGLEALSRAVHPDTGAIISPDTLFQAAQEFDMIIEVDRLCRQSAFAAFQPLHEKEPDFALFFNFESALLDSKLMQPGYLMSQIKKYDLAPTSIVIELIESHVRDDAKLTHFTQSYKKAGFLLALDDMGAGQSTLRRVSTIKPDIIKIDKFFIDNIEREYYKQEIFGALVKMSHKLGALVVAEGIEKPRQAITVLDLGADLLQGHYLHHPKAMGRLNLPDARNRIHTLSDRLRSFKIDKADRTQNQEILNARIPLKISNALRTRALRDFSATLFECIPRYANVECLYVLDMNGIQVSTTALRKKGRARRERFIFHPSEKGYDHSLKEFFLQIKSGREQYLTPPYISLATGRPCQTLSMVFKHDNNRRYILCVDFTNLD